MLINKKKQTWNDYRFAWNASDFDQISAFYMPINDIWV